MNLGIDRDISAEIGDLTRFLLTPAGVAALGDPSNAAAAQS